MADRGTNFLATQSSPTISSVSSSDLDTESTGSFFHDRSTTLGTLMGVSFPAIAFRASSRHHHASPAASAPRVRKRPKLGTSSSGECQRRRRSSRRWWRICGDEEDGVVYGRDARSSSLGEFLEVERRFYGAAPELDAVAVPAVPPERNQRLLFAEGRVLPPGGNESPDKTADAGAAALCFWTGICNCGVAKLS